MAKRKTDFKFKIGDKVKVIKQNLVNAHGFPMKTIVEITYVDMYSPNPYRCTGTNYTNNMISQVLAERSLIGLYKNLSTYLINK